MRKILFTVLALAVVAVGATWAVKHYVPGRAWLNRMEDEAESSKSNAQLLAELKVHISDLSASIGEHELKLLKTQRLVVAMEADLKKCCDARDDHIVQLGEAKKVLASNSTGEVSLSNSNSRKYTRSEIEADVKKRLTHLTHLKALIETKENSLALLRNTHENGKKALQEAGVIKSQKMAELEALASRLKNAEHLNEIRALTSDLNTSFASLQSTQFQKSWRELLDRVDTAEITVKNTGTSGGLIDYRETADTSTDLLKAIDAAIDAPKTVSNK